MIRPYEQRVLDEAHRVAKTLGDNSNHTVASAAMDASGRIFSGVNLNHFTGGSCAELVVLGVAATAGADPLMAIVAVSRRRGVIPPCGKCRQVILDQHPDCQVLIPTSNGTRSLPVRELLPYAYTDDEAQPKRVLTFESHHFDAIVSGSKTRTLRHQERIAEGPVLLSFRNNDGFHRIEGLVESVDQRRLGEITPANFDKSGEAEGLRAEFDELYPNTPDDAEVELVHFRALLNSPHG